MKSFQILLLAAALFASVSAQIGTRQRAVLYDQYNSGGYSLTLPDYAEDLSAIGFDDRTRSVCVTGVWLFYQDKGYNTDNAAGMEYVFGKDNYCVNIRTIPGAVSSVRYAGAPNDYRTSTLTLYEGDYFQGREEYTPRDLPNLNLAGNHKSLIITGNKNDCWTVFDQPEYQGNQICLRPPLEDYTPSFISDLQNIEGQQRIPYGSIKSVRKGCLCPNPESYVPLSSFARSG